MGDLLWICNSVVRYHLQAKSRETLDRNYSSSLVHEQAEIGEMSESVQGVLSLRFPDVIH